MKITQSAKTYAKALAQIKSDNNIIKNDLKEVTETFCKDLYDVFNNPTVSSEIKLDILKETFQNKINPELFEFLTILSQKNRIKQLGEIYEAYLQEINIKNNILDAQITSSIELNDRYKQIIIDKLQQKTQKNIQPHWFVSEEIIGGIIIKIGDLVIDTSLKNKLDKLRKQL